MRKSNPKIPTDEALVDAAEQLFAERSIDQVTFREIGAMVGSANKNVVQYYFGDRNQLIRAVFERRLPDLDKKRANMLAHAEKSGLSNDVRMLLAIVFCPIAELRVENGQRNYASFLSSLLNYQDDCDYLHRTTDGTPFTAYVVQRLRQSCPGLSDQLFLERLRASTALVLTSIGNVDSGRSALADPDAMEESLTLAVAIMTAAPPASSRPIG
jgi:AcrR family transcriptional regulator